jgi:hypothetical protein
MDIHGNFLTWPPGDATLAGSSSGNVSWSTSGMVAMGEVEPGFHLAEYSWELRRSYVASPDPALEVALSHTLWSSVIWAEAITGQHRVKKQRYRPCTSVPGLPKNSRTMFLNYLNIEWHQWEKNLKFIECSPWAGHCNISIWTILFKIYTYI